MNSMPTDLNMVSALTQPRILPLANMFGGPLQVLPPNSAPANFQASYITAATQGITLQNQLGRAAGIQLNRNGQLEYTGMAPQQTGVGMTRRF